MKNAGIHKIRVTIIRLCWPLRLEFSVVFQYYQRFTVNVSVGNKSDSPLRKVSREEGVACAEKYNLHLYETSAKLDLNVTEVC